MHELKCWPPYFEHVMTGRKPFEVRKNTDRRFAEGDTILLREYDGSLEHREPETGGYTGRTCLRRVTYVLGDGDWGIQPGTVVLGLTQPEADPEVPPRCGGEGRIERPAPHYGTEEDDWIDCPGCIDCQPTPELLGEESKLDELLAEIERRYEIEGHKARLYQGTVSYERHRVRREALGGLLSFSRRLAASTQPVSESPGKAGRLKAATKAVETWMLAHDLSGYAFEHLAADVLSAADRAVPMVSADYAARAYIAAQDRHSESPGNSGEQFAQAVKDRFAYLAEHSSTPGAWHAALQEFNQLHEEAGAK